jgi:hypothetical protein
MYIDLRPAALARAPRRVPRVLGDVTSTDLLSALSGPAPASTSTTGFSPVVMVMLLIIAGVLVMKVGKKGVASYKKGVRKRRAKKERVAALERELKAARAE